MNSLGLIALLVVSDVLAFFFGMFVQKTFGTENETTAMRRKRWEE